MQNVMTKCHLLALAVLLALAAAGCKGGEKGPSLSDYGSKSEASQNAQFEEYVRQLRALPLEEALARQEAMMQEAEADSASWERITRLQDHFLQDPNSPWRSEELYIPVVSHLLSSPLASERQKAFAKHLAPRIVLNRLGTPAGDFAFQFKNGRTSTLYETIDSRQPRLTLLFFSNPGCPNCKEITEALSNDPLIQERIDKGELLVVNIYPDEDLQEWLDYLPNYPQQWICGHDPDGVLRSDTVYWVRAIPSLYLLDSEKRVICKDATLEEILVNCKER